MEPDRHAKRWTVAVALVPTVLAVAAVWAQTLREEPTLAREMGTEMGTGSPGSDATPTPSSSSTGTLCGEGGSGEVVVDAEGVVGGASTPDDALRERGLDPARFERAEVSHSEVRYETPSHVEEAASYLVHRFGDDWFVTEGYKLVPCDEPSR